MSLYTSFNTGVSGLGAQSRRLGVISDNIANVNTTGFKAVKSDFSDIVAGEMRAYSSGMSTSTMLAKPDVDRQGQIQKTGVPTDMGISGDGFFIVRDSEQAGDYGYTRAGSFVIDNLGALRTRDGAYVQGVPIASVANVVPPSFGDLSSIRVPQSTLSALPTSRVSIAANLPAAAGTVSATSPLMASVDVYDQLGTPRHLDFAWSTANSTTRAWNVAVRERGVATPISTFNLSFDAAGVLIPPVAGAEFRIQLPGGGTGTATGTGIALNFGDTTALSAPYSLSTIDQNGAPAGQLIGINVDGSGVLSLNFSNGVSKAAYRIPLATFPDPDGLRLSSGNIYRESIASGSGLPHIADTGGAGEIVAESLEGSTVDIAEEMTDMLITQNSYSASAKVINTIDKMLEEAVRIGG